jgi:hypothetical protein
MRFTLVRPLVALCAAAAAGLLLAAALPMDFIRHGNFRRMVHMGETQGVVALAALPSEPGRWGLGATAGLKGELVQIDGRVLVSPGSDAQGHVRAPEAGEMALLFAGARITAWRDLPVPRDLDAAGFEAFLNEQAKAAGLDPAQPFVFRVEGRFPHLLWHVRLFRQPGAAGQLVGVASGAALEGVVSHPGERLHLHYVDAAAAASGHVDRYSVAAGSVLKLPQR